MKLIFYTTALLIMGFLPVSLLSLANVQAQTPLAITHGVASGDVSHTSAIIWARANQPARMVVRFQPLIGTNSSRQVTSAPCSKASDYTCHAKLVDLTPNTQYRYEVWFADERYKSPSEAGSFRTAPDPLSRSSVSFIWGGDLGGQNYCRHINGGYGIFRQMAALRPDFFIANGDMIYADGECPPEGPEGWQNIPGRFLSVSDASVNWLDRDSVQENYYAHWRYNRADPAFQEFLRLTPMYVQWDDHEVINDFGASWPHYEATPQRPGYENIVAAGRQALFDFHPLERHPEEPDRIYRSFSWGRDMELFILDARSYRSENKAHDSPQNAKTLLGTAQRQWLTSGLIDSSATWKIVSCDVSLSVATGARAEELGRDSFANGTDSFPATQTGFEQELLQILKTLDTNNVKNIVFIVTDVHFAAQLRYDIDLDSDGDTLLFHELICGPLNAARVSALPGFDPTLNPVVLYAEGGIFNFSTVRLITNGNDRPSLQSDIRDETGTIRPGSRLMIFPQ